MSSSESQEDVDVFCCIFSTPWLGIFFSSFQSCLVFYFFALNSKKKAMVQKVASNMGFLNQPS